MDSVDVAYQLFHIESNKRNFVEFYSFSEDELFKNALWIVGNLAASFQFMRILFFEDDLYSRIRECLINCLTDKELIERISWLVGNITKGSIKIYEKKVIYFLNFINKLINLKHLNKKIEV